MEIPRVQNGHFEKLGFVGYFCTMFWLHILLSFLVEKNYKIFLETITKFLQRFCIQKITQYFKVLLDWKITTYFMQ